MTVLVTGATGLVGARLLPRLTEAGYDCRALIRPGKIVTYGGNAVEGDILDPSTLGKAVEGVEAIIHLAATFRTADAAQIWHTNVEGTRLLIEAAKAYAPAARFIMASTGLVYPSQGSGPALESDDVHSERDYPASKIAAEKLLSASGLNWSVLRFGFVYGDDDGHIAQIPHLAQLLNLHPANRLSMIHHQDIAKFVEMGIEGRFDGRIVNTVDDAPISVHELNSIAGGIALSGTKSLDEPWAGVMDGSLARSLGFKPQVSTIWQAVRDNIL